MMPFKSKEKHNASQRKSYAANKVARRARRNALNAANPEAKREWSRRSYVKHRKTILKRRKAARRANLAAYNFAQRQRAYKAKGIVASRPCPKKCECCGGPPGKKALCLDHCHATKRFRGWICFHCNIGIGKLGDNLEGVLNATAYLVRAG